MKSFYNILFSSLIFLAVYTNCVFSQNSQANWINYNQQYFKIQLAQDGLHRIPYSSLLQAGIPVDNIDPRWIQIFFQGEEQYIYIHGEGTSGIFDPNGYIEFYGQRNKSELDLEFYDNPNNCVNPDYSMYSDMTCFIAIFYKQSWITNVSDNNLKIARLMQDL